MDVQIMDRKFRIYMGMLVGLPVLFALSAMQEVHAIPRVTLGEVSYLGTGCGRGDSISGSGLTRTLDLRHFKAGAGYALRRSACNVAIAVTVPRGYQVSLTANFQGSVKGSAKLIRSYGTSMNPAGASLSSNLASAHGKRFSQSDAGNGAWSACGMGSGNLRLNSSVMATGGASRIGVDKMTLRVAVRPCR